MWLPADIEYVEGMTLGDCLLASCAESAHRFGKIALSKPAKVRNILLADDPSDDGWVIINKDEFYPLPSGTALVIDTCIGNFVTR